MTPGRNSLEKHLTGAHVHFCGVSCCSKFLESIGVGSALLAQAAGKTCRSIQPVANCCLLLMMHMACLVVSKLAPWKLLRIVVPDAMVPFSEV